MNQIIKTNTIDINDLVSNNTKLNDNIQSKILDILKEELSDEEYKWFIANLFIYMNYNQKTEFPINLETAVKLLGFAHKKNAKRTLENNFTKELDYKLIKLPREQKQNAGRCEEEIILNVDTFKNMCLLVKSEKGKMIRRYYVKLENIYNKIIKDEIETKNKLLVEKEQQLINNSIEYTKDLKLSKHTTLLEKFNNKPCIYLTEVSDNLIKCGSSQDIIIRKDDLKRVYGKCIFLDMFECTKNNFREIEQRILCKVKDYLYKEAINGHISKEVIKLNEKTFNYKQLVTIITNEIKNYSDLGQEYNEFKKLDLITKLIDKNFTFEQIDKLLNTNLNNNNNNIQKIENEQKIQPEIANTIIKRGRKIQVISPDNLNVIVKIYDSMIFALRDPLFNYDKHSIQKAVKMNTIYKRFRWMFVDHGHDINIIKDIQPTVTSRQSELNIILQLNNTKTEIIKNYHSITLIKNEFKVSLPRLHKIINQHLLFNDSFFIKIQECSPELVEKYEKNNTFSVRTSSKSKKVKQINIKTNEEIIYKSITESSIKFGSSEKSITDSIKNNIILNGYKFEFI